MALSLGIRLGGGRGCGLHELLGPRGVGRAGLGCGCSRGADQNSRAASVSSRSDPRGPRALTLRVGTTRTRGEAQLPAGRTLRTQRMNDGSAVHSERAQVAPVSSRAGPPWALGAATCLCGWLWRNLLGTVWQTLGPTPIPAERTLPVSVGWCVFTVDAP